MKKKSLILITLILITMAFVSNLRSAEPPSKISVLWTESLEIENVSINPVTVQLYLLDNSNNWAEAGQYLIPSGVTKKIPIGNALCSQFGYSLMGSSTIYEVPSCNFIVQ